MEPFVNHHVFFNMNILVCHKIKHEQLFENEHFFSFTLWRCTERFVQCWMKVWKEPWDLVPSTSASPTREVLKFMQNTRNILPIWHANHPHFIFIFSHIKAIVHAVVQFVLRLLVVEPIVLYAWLYFKVSRLVNCKQVHAKWCLHFICNVSPFDVKSKEVWAKLNHKSIISKGRAWR